MEFDMRELTMNEALDVNGAGWGDFFIGIAGSAAWDGVKAGAGALYDMRNNPGESPGSFYDLHF
jgi:hypothetical protein